MRKYLSYIVLTAIVVVKIALDAELNEASYKKGYQVGLKIGNNEH